VLEFKEADVRILDFALADAIQRQVEIVDRLMSEQPDGRQLGDAIRERGQLLREYDRRRR
jgi:hypothetical protein